MALCVCMADLEALPMLHLPSYHGRIEEAIGKGQRPFPASPPPPPHCLHGPSRLDLFLLLSEKDKQQRMNLNLGYI